MSFTYPDFLNPPNGNPSGNVNSNSHLNQNSSNQSGPSPGSNTSIPPIGHSRFDEFQLPPNSNPNIIQGSKFNDILFNKLLDEQQKPQDDKPTGSPTSTGYNDMLPMTSPLVNPFSPQILPFNNNGFYNRFDSFNLPSELQGGIGNISSRRPSYAAESFTRSIDHPLLNSHWLVPQQPQTQPGQSGQPGQPGPGQSHPGQSKNVNLAQFATMNSYNVNQLSDGFSQFNLNSNLNDFQSRRPSQLVDFDHMNNMNQVNSNLNLIPQGQSVNQSGPGSGASPSSNSPGTTGMGNNSGTSDLGVVKLENRLLLKNQYIVASPELKTLFNKTIKYFQNVELSKEILTKIKKLLANAKILKLIAFIKNINNLTFNHKILCLVINKNGKFDLLSYPNNSNIHLQKDDLVIVDGDRGKDLVMILEPLIDLNFAILFNFLKKIEHLKSLNIVDDHHCHNNENLKKFGGTHSLDLNASQIVNNHSNEDNEFIITLPTKQVLRFATPREIHKISGKFLEEKKAFITCYNKIKELNLQDDLQLINVEYQSDFKKLIFYYFANFKRIDFRGLIKELFKIYKTRIWLCAVLPHDNAESLKNNHIRMPPLNNQIPIEYNLSNDQIMKFSINEFESLNEPNYFHLKNLNNLIDLLNYQLKGNFYGFDDSSTGTK